MCTEIPEVKRCCCCLPLRRGLIFWMYLKLAISLLLLLFFTDGLVNLIRRPLEVMYFYVVIITLIMTSMEVVFSILFLVTAHQKNPAYMKIYYRYAIFMLILQVLVLMGYSGYEIYVAYYLERPQYLIGIKYNYVLEAICFTFAQIVLQVYLLIVVRSEVRKLENAINYEFINRTSETICKPKILL